MLSTPWATNFAHSPHGDVIISPWPGSKHAKLPRETYENDRSWKITTALSWIPPHSCPFLFPIFIVRCMKLPFFYSFISPCSRKYRCHFHISFFFFYYFFCFYSLRDNFFNNLLTFFYLGKIVLILFFVIAYIEFCILLFRLSILKCKIHVHKCN